MPLSKELQEMLKRHDETKLPPYAWPGGYQIVYYCRDGGVLCPDCANGENGSETRSPELEWGDAADWDVEAMDIYYEGPVIQCDHCNADIESAYGDPDNLDDKE